MRPRGHQCLGDQLPAERAAGDLLGMLSEVGVLPDLFEIEEDQQRLQIGRARRS